MKKLFLGLGIALVIAACSGSGSKPINDSTSTATKSFQTAQADLPTLITLNGFYLNDADKMEKGFFANSNSHNAQTDTWYDAKYVHQLDSLLNAENADGFRIYFARNISATNKKHNIILVSTRPRQIHLTNPDRDTTIHQDYFEHAAPFLTKPNRPQGIIGWGADISRIKGGAISYDPNVKCPKGCFISNEHYITCDEARSRIKRLGSEVSNATINTSSEWFDIHLLDILDKELNDNTTNVYGMRIYFAKKYIPKQNYYRFSFVIMKTKLVGGVHMDDYDCNYLKKKEGYDNGEQCPNNCYGATWQPDSTKTMKIKTK
jgi:hypothetical protein